MAAAQVTCLSLMLLPRAETNPDEAHRAFGARFFLLTRRDSRVNEQVLEGDKLHQSSSGPCGDEDFE
jgi:hypothetical protein